MQRRLRKPKTINYQKLMPIRVSDTMYDKLRASADRRDWDLSKLVRHALSTFLAHDEETIE